MALRAPRRLLTAALAGGLVTGSLLLGAGSAMAAPSSDDVVEARCGQTVRAEPGQTIKVIPELGLPFEREVRRGMEPIAQVVGGIGGLLCRVQVQVVEPVASGVAQAAPPLRPATDQLSRGTGAVLDPTPQPRATTPRSQAATPAPAAAVPTLTPQQAAAAAPAFAPAFGALPSSFLRSASGPAPGLAAYDPNMLLGSAFPGLRAGAPAYLGYDAASAVTTASQVQALPVDGLTDGGVGVPALIAVLALSGVAAFTVRRIVLGKAPVAAGAAPVTEPADELAEDATEDDAAENATEDATEDDAAEDVTTAAPRTPVPA
ncbi:hypothetical protein PHK61_22075 [Actinomycetospora lutea]|uniref:hypothetical protein n=1 Tax=Actinomycetospora lutea TaxID=663604 RepID=UPI002366A160|nr:hypothetical protein [Actinomycetospora lutea]MDD7941111.1 hypothetical protein [Actinomycetospora lutea]